MENTKFSKREWIHLIITLSIIQAGVWFVSFVYAGNSSALGYVSFAGTLISIILAVLAIGYTYGESQQQKNSSSTLASQLESLVKIKDKLEIQADALDDIKKLKDILSSFSDKVDNHFNETKQAIDKMNLSNVRENFYTKQSEKTKNIQIDKESVFLKLFSDFSFFRLNVFLICVLFMEKKTNTNKILRRYTAKKFIDNIGIEIDHNNTNLSNEILFGGVVDMLTVLTSLDLINEKNNTIDDMVIQKFNDLIKNINEEQLASFRGFTSELIEFAKTSSYYKES
ncbi:hypothetical protein [Acinetobacter nosocomialis]|uniref:hypothetical protein n=2 Tax=Acinetobacter nosocomialis TaxID=106654 RepID=UPI00124E62BD|nr:hypothetical protein [Acinetobacter nosocomialis]